MDGNALASLFGFWMMMQLVAMLALLVGGIYVMFCLGRASAGIDRLATAMEIWVERQTPQESVNPPANPPILPVPPSLTVPPVQPPTQEYSTPHEPTF